MSWNDSSEAKGTLGESIFIGHGCFLHHLNGAVGRVALELLWLYDLFCFGFTPISFTMKGFIVRWICIIICSGLRSMQQEHKINNIVCIYIRRIWIVQELYMPYIHRVQIGITGVYKHHAAPMQELVNLWTLANFIYILFIVILCTSFILTCSTSPPLAFHNGHHSNKNGQNNNKQRCKYS